MRENKKYKEVKVRCYKTGQNLYSEIFQNITEKQLEKELNKMVRAGWDRFDIDTDGKKRTLVLKKSRQSCQQTRVHNNEKSPVKSIIDGGEIPSEPGSEVNSGRLNRDSELILNGIAKAKDWKQLAIEDREKRKRKK